MPTDPRGLRSGAPLLDAWLSFQESAGLHPFTIPGHKQRPDLVGDVVAGDVPLYAGLDSMKLTGGLLTRAESLAAALWGADQCHFSVGGSTHGNQAVALALGRPGDQIVLSRTAHRSMTTALALADLQPTWLLPPVDERTGLPLPHPPEQVAAALAQTSPIAVHLTDAAYVGTCGDVAGWAQTCHRADLPLVVDAAWSAHFGFHPDLPQHALARGADAMVTSAHKALPAWSQAALVLAQGSRIDLDRLASGVEATHTTSQSGAILASIDAARALLQRDGIELIEPLIAAVANAREELAAVPGLVVLDGPGVDPLKLTLVLGGTGADGNAIEADLIAQGMPVELADRDTIVAMVTLADRREDLERLTAGLLGALRRHRGVGRAVQPAAAYSVTPEVVQTPREAFFARRVAVPLAAAIGRIGAELIAPYPPGIAVLAPGERITDAVIEALDTARRCGVRVAYAADPTLASVYVVA